MKYFLFCVFISLQLAVPTPALDTPPNAHMQAASELVSIMELERTMMGGATAMVDAMLQQNAALIPYRGTLLKWAEKYLTWEQMGPKVAAMYADTFSEPELRELIAFYTTPTGKKVLATMPDLAKRGAMMGAEVAQAHQLELEQMIRERAKELDEAKPQP